MIILLRRRYLIVIVTLLLAALVASALCFHKSDAETVPAFSADRARETVIIDAGHGGADGGAVSASGVIESELNLQIAKKACSLLCFFGQNAVMTRTGEDGLYDPDSTTIRQKKVADTRNRVKFINSYDPAVLISIHQNILPNAPKVHGAQVFYNTQPHAAELANSVQSALNLSINLDNEKAETAIAKTIYIMSHVNCDAVLVECGFLSNEAETERLQESEYQRKLAAAIVCGYLNDKG